ncbi:MAG: RNA polymerase sigma factor [Patescibacteria group bacterium]|nr:RNA polymerase sigma factor [Patescibacteria group bacterium]
MNDQRIIKQIQRGNVRAFAAIYDKYIEKIYRFVFLKVSTKENAEDLTSQIFIKTLNYLIEKTDKEIENLNAFLYQVARNTIADFYRQQGRAQEIQSIDQEELESLPDKEGQGLEKKVILNLDILQVKKALQKINPDYQEAIILYYLEEFSVGEISQIVNRTPGATRQIIHRGLESLRQILNSNEEHN